MKTITMKHVEKDVWNEFKAMAAKNGMSMGKFFRVLVKEYKKETNTFWKEIFDEPKILSDAEAKDIECFAKKVRKEKGFRI